MPEDTARRTFEAEDTMSRTSRRTLIWLAVAVGAVVAFVLWTHRLPAKARALAPVIAQLQAAHAATGQFPANPESLASVQTLERSYSVYFGQRTGSNFVWSTSDVSSHDLTLLVDTNGFCMFAPTGRMKLLSFSSFPVWRRTNEDTDWRRGRIHWSFLGTYWSKD